MDSIRRFLFEDLDIRGAVVSLGNAWHEMNSQRNDPPLIQALLGELAAAAALIGGNLKSPGRLTLQLQGHGVVTLLLADCDEQLRLRGTARYKVGAGATVQQFSALLGDAQLTLTLQTNCSPPYQSVVPLIGDSLAMVLEHYLAQSEQQPARLILFANDDHAGGLFLQKLPNADNKDPDGWNRIEHLAATLKPTELSKSPVNLLMQLFPEENIRLFDPRQVRYHCPRDEEKVLAMLKSLGRAEVIAALAEQGELQIEDDICHHIYRYSADIVPQLFD